MMTGSPTGIVKMISKWLAGRWVVGRGEESPRDEVPPLSTTGVQMIEITVDTAVPSPSGLRLGCRIEYGRGGAVRFVQVLVPWSVVTYQVLQESVELYDRRGWEAQPSPGLW